MTGRRLFIITLWLAGTTLCGVAATIEWGVGAGLAVAGAGLLVAALGTAMDGDW